MTPVSARACIFVPVYQQARDLPRVLEEIAAARLEAVDFLLVNNGSNDGSEALVRQSGFPFLDLRENRGVGYSYMLALDWALGRAVEGASEVCAPGRYGIFGAMAANGKMAADEVPRLVDPIREGRADYVTGSRFLDGGASPNLPRFRRATIPMVNQWVRLTTGARVTDATNGFRAFALSWMSRARFDWHAPWLHTYAFEYYLYAKFLLEPRVRAIEVPTSMRYPREGKYSHIRPIIDHFAMLRPWLVARADGLGFT